MYRAVTPALALLFLLPGVTPAAAQAVEEVPVIGGPCEGCEAVFLGMPDSIGGSTRLAPLDEPGEPMVIDGTVYDAGGRPVLGVIVYAYHTNAAGIYEPAPGARGWVRRHGHLRGWARTDARGRYRFITIRPGPYPGRNAAEHVHMHVIEPGCCTYWIHSLHFDDDPLLTDEERRDAPNARGGDNLASPEREANGVWHVRRDIVLGRGVPDYRRHDHDHGSGSGT